MGGQSRIFEVNGDLFYEQNPPFNFGGLEKGFSDFSNSWATIIPVPYDATTTFQPGARGGPEALLRASQELELYDEELDFEVYRRGISTISPVLPNISSPQNMVMKVKRVVSRVLDFGKLPVLIGGEHLMSVGAIRALCERHSLTVLHFDAHVDRRETYQGSSYSNACVIRLLDSVARTVSVGVRSLSKDEHLLLKTEQVPCYFAQDLAREFKKSCKALLKNLRSPVYITVDLDVLDPSIMPAVGTPEPGGLGWYEMLFILKRVCENFKIVGFDVMELLPCGGNIAPNFLAAKLVYKILSYIGYGEREP